MWRQKAKDEIDVVLRGNTFLERCHLFWMVVNHENLLVCWQTALGPVVKMLFLFFSTTSLPED